MQMIDRYAPLSVKLPDGKHEADMDPGDVYAMDACLNFGCWDNDLVAYGVVGQGVAIWTCDYEGDPTIEVIEGCPDCHYTGMRFVNGEPDVWCGCEAGTEQKAFSDWMSKMVDSEY